MLRNEYKYFWARQKNTMGRSLRRTLVLKNAMHQCLNHDFNLIVIIILVKNLVHIKSELSGE